MSICIDIHQLITSYHHLIGSYHHLIGSYHHLIASKSNPLYILHRLLICPWICLGIIEPISRTRTSKDVSSIMAYFSNNIYPYLLINISNDKQFHPLKFQLDVNPIIGILYSFATIIKLSKPLWTNE